MGEVYRARDLSLNRTVAPKILPLLFANDADRLARFKREGQVLASLNQPNIAAIHGLEESGPDGGWIAYSSRDSGDEQVWVRPYPEVDSNRWRISTDGASSRAGRPPGGRSSIGAGRR